MDNVTEYYRQRVRKFWHGVNLSIKTWIEVLNNSKNQCL